MTAHLLAPTTAPHYIGGLPPLLASVRYEKPHTKALRLGLRRYGPTPLYDAVVADLGEPVTS